MTQSAFWKEIIQNEIDKHTHIICILPLLTLGILGTATNRCYCPSVEVLDKASKVKHEWKALKVDNSCIISTLVSSICYEG